MDKQINENDLIKSCSECGILRMKINFCLGNINHVNNVQTSTTNIEIKLTIFEKSMRKTTNRY